MTGRREADERRRRHRDALGRWPRLWGRDRDLGPPGDLSGPLSAGAAAHLHGVGSPAGGRAVRRRAPARRLDVLLAGDRPFVALGSEAGRQVLLAGVPASEATRMAGCAVMAAGRLDGPGPGTIGLGLFPDAAAVEAGRAEAVIPLAGGHGPDLLQALDAARAVLVVVEVPGGRRRLTRDLEPALLARLRALRP